MVSASHSCDFLPAPSVVADAQQPTAIVDEGPERHLIYTPGDIEWRPGPGSFQPGAEFAVLEGDPSQPGVFTMQIRMPDGFVIAPHWHPGVERVTVLSGAFHLGHGDTLDRQAAQRLPPGATSPCRPRCATSPSPKARRSSSSPRSGPGRSPT
jgi:hypothetical protein